MRDVDAVLDPVGRAHPKLTLGITGGHAIAAATEKMLTRDLVLVGDALDGPRGGACSP